MKRHHLAGITALALATSRSRKPRDPTSLVPPPFTPLQYGFSF